MTLAVGNHNKIRNGKMKRIIAVLMGLVILFSGCAGQKMFKYADEKADKSLVEKTLAEEKVKKLEAEKVLFIEEYDKALKFITDTRAGILKANFPVPYLKYLNTLAGWNFIIEVAVPDTSKAKK